MYLGDVGQNSWEEINFIPRYSKGGINFGWNILEASSCYNDDCEKMSIVKKDEFHLYQRIELTRDGYKLDLIQKDSGFPSWAKYLLFMTLFGVGYGQS